MEKITVIVPIYNIDERLEFCLESLVNQKTNSQFKYNIFLIDDGSTDNSKQICDMYKNRYSEIISVVHKKNEGVSQARNYGLDHSTSRYVAFVDPDDYVTDHYLLNLYNALIKTNSDISSCWFEEKWDNTFRKSKGKKISGLQELNSEEALRKLFYQNGLEFAIWGKLIKRDLFSGIHFQVGKRYEDVLVTYSLISNCRKITVINNKDYIYWQRENGMLNSAFNKSKLDILPAMNILCKRVQQDYPELDSAVACRYFAGLSNVYFQIPTSNLYKSMLWDAMVKVRRKVLFDSRASTKVRLGALSTYFGKKITNFLYIETQKRGRSLQ